MPSRSRSTRHCGGASPIPPPRIYTVDAVSSTIFLQAADNLDERREAMTEGLLSLLLPVVLLVPLSMASIWYFVEALTEAAGRLAAGDRRARRRQSRTDGGKRLNGRAAADQHLREPASNGSDRAGSRTGIRLNSALK